MSVVRNIFNKFIAKDQMSYLQTSFKKVCKTHTKLLLLSSQCICVRPYLKLSLDQIILLGGKMRKGRASQDLNLESSDP